VGKGIQSNIMEEEGKEGEGKGRREGKLCTHFHTDKSSIRHCL
jgi:hypothetical protein